MTKLTNEQASALRWIDAERSYFAGWTENGQQSERGPEHWTHIRIRSDASSILIKREDLWVICDCIEAAPEPDTRMWRLTEIGRIALAEHPSARARQQKETGHDEADG